MHTSSLNTPHFRLAMFAAKGCSLPSPQHNTTPANRHSHFAMATASIAFREGYTVFGGGHGAQFFCASCLPLNAACLFARCLISDCIVWLIPTSFLGAFAQYTQRAHSTKALPYPTLMRSIAIPPKLYPSQLSFITFLCRQSCVPSAVQPTPPEAVNRLRGFLRIPNVSLGYFDSAPQI